MESIDNNVPKQDEPLSTQPKVRPQWRRPTFALLDVERGTVTTTGRFADGNGSTS